MTYPLLGTLTSAHFQSKIMTAVESDRKNPVEAVCPYPLRGTIHSEVADGRYAIKVTPTGQVTLHSRMIFNEEGRTALLSPQPESPTVTPLGQLEQHGDAFQVFPDSSLKLYFPLVALGSAEPFIFFFNVKTEWQLITDGLKG